MFIGVDMIELGMVSFLAVCVGLGLYFVYESVLKPDHMLAVLWALYLALAVVFLVAITSVTSAEDVVARNIEQIILDFLSRGA